MERGTDLEKYPDGDGIAVVERNEQVLRWRGGGMSSAQLQLQSSQEGRERMEVSAQRQACDPCPSPHPSVISPADGSKMERNPILLLYITWRQLIQH